MKVNNVTIPNKLSKDLLYHTNNYFSFRNTRWNMTEDEYKSFVNEEVEKLSNEVSALSTESLKYKEDHDNGDCICCDLDDEDYYECEYKEINDKINNLNTRIRNVKTKTKGRYLAEVDAELLSKVELSTVLIQQYLIDKHFSLNKKLTLPIYRNNYLVSNTSEVELIGKSTSTDALRTYKIGNPYPTIIPGKTSILYTGIIDNTEQVNLIPWKNGLLVV